MKRRLWAAMATTLILFGTVSARAQSGAPPAFAAGQADRADWEAWFGDRQGDYRAGAEYWAAQRNMPKPGPCANPSMSQAWQGGCSAARSRLARPDARLQSELDYRRGWNSYSPTGAGAQQVFKLQCWPDDSVEQSLQDPIVSVIITLSNAILDPSHRVDGREFLSVVHISRSGSRYERNQQYDVKNLFSTSTDVIWIDVLKKSPSVSITGVIGNVYSYHPRYIERIVSSIDGRPPRLITSADCRPVIAPQAPKQSVAQAGAAPAPQATMAPVSPQQPAAQTPPQAAPAPAQVLPSASGECSRISDATQRLACYDNTSGNAQAAASPTPQQPAPETTPSKPDSNQAADQGSALPPSPEAQDPVSVTKNDSREPGIMWELDISGRADNVTIENVIVNRGNCKAQSPPQLPQTLKFGELIYMVGICVIQSRFRLQITEGQPYLGGKMEKCKITLAYRRTNISALVRGNSCLPAMPTT